MKNLFQFIKNTWFPILFIIGGILDQNTDLFVQLLTDINCPNWVATAFRIMVISCGTLKIYLIIPKNKPADAN